MLGIVMVDSSQFVLDDVGLSRAEVFQIFVIMGKVFPKPISAEFFLRENWDITLFDVCREIAQLMICRANSKLNARSSKKKFAMLLNPKSITAKSGMA